MKPIVLAYVSDWNFTGMPREHADLLTHVNYSFLRIVEGRASAAHWENEASLLALQEENPDLSVCVSLGGWEADGFSQGVANEENRERLAQSTVELIERYHFKGIDLDWEYPCDDVAGIAAAPEDKENFTLFIKLLRQKLSRLQEKTKIPYLLTMAVGVSENCAANIEFRKLTEELDFVNLMTYDLSPWSGVTGHHTALYPPACEQNRSCGETAVTIFEGAGVPAERLVLGCGFYGRKYTGVDKTNNGLFQKHSGEMPTGIPYADIKKRLLQTAKRYFDEQAKAPYMYDEADQLFATYEDSESLRHKVAFVKEKKLKGILFWEYNSDKSGELLNALK